MAIWFSDHRTPLPIRGMGNGNLSVWFEGASLFSIRAGYSTPHICSMAPDFGGAYHELETLQTGDGKGLRHRLFYSNTILEMPTRAMCDLLITDLQPEEMNVLIRRFEGISALCWRMSIPSYVRAVFHPAYRFGKHRADTLFLTVPAGTPFENGMATVKEQTVALVFSGTFRYDPMDHTVRYGGDLAELYFLCCDDAKEMARMADRLLEAFCQYGDGFDLHPIYGKTVGDYSDITDSLSPVLPLLAMQSQDGGVVASHREPYAAAADLPALTDLFLCSDRSDAAMRMLLCWTAAQEEMGFIPAHLLCGKSAVCEGGQLDYSATAAYLLAATRLFSALNPQGKEGTVLFRGMRTAFSGLMQGFREGMLPFSSRTAAFDAGILGRELLFQGSAEVTALGIHAAQAFIAFCQSSGKRAAKDEKGYRRILAEAVKSYEKNFTFKGKICRNAPRLETLVRRPRFIRGVCTLCQREGAYPFEDHLELDKYGRYLCRRCFATRRGAPEETDPAKRYTSPRATLIAALLLGSSAAMKEIPLLAMSYTKRYHDPQAALPLREADTDPLMLLTLQARREELCAVLQENEKLLSKVVAQAAHFGFSPITEKVAEALVDFLLDGVRAILAEESEEGTLSALLYDTVSLGAHHTAGSTALYLLAST